ncbi:MAG: beta-N-acetylglucosaminidase domain-containing protein [Pseudomonadales bacterium]|nr:beta-N-acetylglucosaminidase domain-containing protein [Pseudomonadales bacterium]
MPATLLTGVIEGFYGRGWPFETRLAYAGYLSRLGLNTCLYCPKEDPFLRKRWREHWPQQQWQHLRQLAGAYRQQQVLWGWACHPTNCTATTAVPSAPSCGPRSGAWPSSRPPLLAILFDDMPGDMSELAQRQAEIVADVAAELPGVRLLVCPTYYSFDPVLEKFFGAMPAGYWPLLGRPCPRTWIFSGPATGSVPMRCGRLI